MFAPLAQAVDLNRTLQVRLAVNVGRDGDFTTPEHQILARTFTGQRSASARGAHVGKTCGAGVERVRCGRGERVWACNCSSGCQQFCSANSQIPRQTAKTQKAQNFGQGLLGATQHLFIRTIRSTLLIHISRTQTSGPVIKQARHIRLEGYKRALPVAIDELATGFSSHFKRRNNAATRDMSDDQSGPGPTSVVTYGVSRCAPLGPSA